MTGNRAFASDAGRKAAILERLDAHLAAGELKFDGDVWNGTTGRPTGCAVHSDDIKVFEAETGYPAVLGILLNYLHFQIRGRNSEDSRARANTFALAWLSRPDPGADLSLVASDLILKALRREKDEDPGLAERHPMLARAIDHVMDLHHEVLAGRAPTRAAWTAARTEAVAATDAAEHKTDKAIGSGVESICWNPATSRSVLVDLARQWAQIRYNREISASGWTGEDQAAADTILQTLWTEQTEQREAGETVDYLALFAARDRDLADRFNAQLELGHKAYPAAMAAFAEMGLDALGATKIPADAGHAA